MTINPFDEKLKPATGCTITLNSEEYDAVKALAKRAAIEELFASSQWYVTPEGMDNKLLIDHAEVALFERNPRYKGMRIGVTCDLSLAEYRALIDPDPS